MRELTALAKQSTMLHRGLPRRAPSAHRVDDKLVVFVHGVGATAGIFYPLEQALRTEGITHFASFTFHPLRTVNSLADEIATMLAPVTRSTPVYLVGHSLGGVAIRYFVQQLGGDWVRRTFSIASPFHGTQVAMRLPFALAQQLRPESALLAKLRHDAKFHSVKHTSFVASDDAVVTPAHSAELPHHECVWLPNVGHNGVLFAPEMHKHIVRHVAE